MEGVVGGVDEVITDDGLRITDYGLRITDYGLRITDWLSEGSKVQITNY